MPVDRWFRDRGDETLGIEYALTADSVVFEVGGYRGAWSSKIAQLYDPHLYVFEPVSAHFQSLMTRFAHSPKIKLFDFGLGSKDEGVELALAEDGSSLFGRSDTKEHVVLRDICSFVRENHISAIDLIQINIEGGEYALLSRMLASDLVAKCHYIKVQFHETVPEAHLLRSEIRHELNRTHQVMYDYPFVWESWEARP
jgi:FkbM family methyltransferase